MHLTLSPIRGLPGQPETALHVMGNVLTIDGTPHDLSPVPEDGEGEWPDSPIIGRITRKGGALQLAVQVVLGDDAMNDQPPDPAHWVIANARDDVVIPARRKPEPEAKE